MRPTSCSWLLGSLLACIQLTNGHIAAFGPGMYCRNGPTPSSPNLNSNTPVDPLYQLSRADWWFQHDRGCDKVPPPAGEFLELPAGSEFTVELANNQAFTTLSYGGSKTSDWPDGGDHPDDWNGKGRDPNGAEGCIPADEGGYMHVQNETMAQGTAFAIAYESDLSKISMEDLVVFSVLEHTPWKRLATYQVPALLPACPQDGCTCAWLWVPLGCGQPNMYMQPYKCKVITASPTAAKVLAKAQPPTYCANEQSECVSGAKQMIVFNQKEGDNTGYQSGQGPSPAYNARNGFRGGAQNDIFVDQPATAVSTTVSTTGSAQDGLTTLTSTSTSTTVGGVKEDLQTSTGAIPAVTSVVAPPGDFPADLFSNLPLSHSQTTKTSSVHSYTTTMTGRIGRPTKFTCYAEED